MKSKFARAQYRTYLPHSPSSVQMTDLMRLSLQNVGSKNRYSCVMGTEICKIKIKKKDNRSEI